MHIADSIVMVECSILNKNKTEEALNWKKITRVAQLSTFKKKICKILFFCVTGDFGRVPFILQTFVAKYFGNFAADVAFYWKANYPNYTKFFEMLTFSNSNYFYYHCKSLTPYSLVKLYASLNKFNLHYIEYIYSKIYNEPMNGNVMG